MDYSLADSFVSSSTTRSRATSSSLRYGCETDDAKRGSFVALRTFYAFGARSGLSSYHPTRRSHSLSTRNTRPSRSARESPFPSLSVDIPVQRSLTGNISEMCHPSSSRALPTEEVRPRPSYSSTLRVPTRDSITKRERAFTPLSLSLPTQVFPSPTTGPTNKESVSNERSLSSEELQELRILRERNKILEAEIHLLKKRLEENKRSEAELKKKLEESDASVKKWKSKFEQQQKLPVEKEVIKEPAKEDIPEDLIEQLDNAADKLSRISATKDFKMLQNEIENALKEMQCR